MVMSFFLPALVLRVAFGGLDLHEELDAADLSALDAPDSQTFDCADAQPWSR